MRGLRSALYVLAYPCFLLCLFLPSSARADSPVICNTDLTHPVMGTLDALGHPHCPGSTVTPPPASSYAPARRPSASGAFNNAMGALGAIADEEAARDAARQAEADREAQAEAERRAREALRRQAMAAADAQRRAAACNPFNGCDASHANDNPFDRPDPATCDKLLQMYKQALANIPQNQPWQSQADYQLQQAENARWGYQAEHCGTLPNLPSHAPKLADQAK